MIKKKFFLFIIGLFFLSGLLIVGKIFYLIQIWKYQGPDLIFTIDSGETFARINYRLSKNKVISDPKVFHRYAQFNNVLTKFKQGRYLIKHNSNMLEVINTLVKGKSLAIKITFPEGKNIFQIAKILDNKKICSYEEFLKWAQNPNFTQSLEIPAETVEGYLYPETYNLSINTPAKQIIKLMVKEFNKQVSGLPFNNSKLTKHQIIIIASIVEKETGAGHERPMIAGLFLNRISKRMRLHSDPTTIYGIFEKFDGNLTKKHLRQKTAYNTYRINGLPKGPISNPGIESINAVLNPKQHNYLYFVSQNDGTHFFSKTYKEHINAVNRFQKNYKNRKGKSWRDLKSKNLIK